MKFVSVTKLLVFTLFFFSACSGGGGGNSPSPSISPPAAASVTLATSQTSTTIYGIDATVNLPSGVTIKSTVSPPAADDGVVIASGVAAAGSVVTAVYSAATSTLPGTVRIMIVNANGFGVGEFAKLNCGIASGYNPTANDFTTAHLIAKDGNGTDIAGVAAEIKPRSSK